MGKHLHVWTGVGLLGLLAVWACSKENTIDNSQTNTYSTAVVCQGPTVDNAMCEAAPEAPPGAFCVYGHCCCVARPEATRVAYSMARVVRGVVPKRAANEVELRAA